MKLKQTIKLKRKDLKKLFAQSIGYVEWRHIDLDFSEKFKEFEKKFKKMNLTIESYPSDHLLGINYVSICFSKEKVGL